MSQFSIQFTQAIRVTREHFKQQKALLNQYDDIRHHLLEAELILEQQEQGLEPWLNKLQEALENQEGNAVDFVEQFKLNLYSKEIFVFSPKGLA